VSKIVLICERMSFKRESVRTHTHLDLLLMIPTPSFILELIAQVPIAFKKKMTHEFLQFASLIAIRCARHRRETRDIHSFKAVLRFKYYLE
jgi:hypothetical protein